MLKEDLQVFACSVSSCKRDYKCGTSF